MLNDKILKQIEDRLKFNEEFLKSEVESARKIENDLDKHISTLSKNKEEWEGNVTQLIKKAQHHTEMKKKGDKYVDEKRDDLAIQQKNIDSALTFIRESCSKIKPKEFSKLDIEKNEFLSFIFKTLFVILYDEEES